MPIKKSELYASIWKSCDELRGGMDASQYKDYVLVLLFVKYVSDKYGGRDFALIEVPDGGGFQDIVALKGSKNIGDEINKIVAKLAEANDLKGVIDVADFNNPDKLGRGKEMQDRLTNLVAIFENPALDFSRNRADDDDLLGDAYEYLMRNFATQSGKSKGQFYTPAEVSRVIAKVIGVNQAQRQDQTIYDPTAGSGSLLIRAADEAERGLSIYGQEMDNATRALAKMNMILHGHPTAEIWQDNTLARPHFRADNGQLKTFDFAVANPPFSAKAWRTGFNPENDEFGRFDGFGIPPTKNGDYAFLLHLVRSLKSSGKGAIILPHGVLFRGNVEADIRRNLVRRGYIKGIIGLPANLFYGTGIPACIIVIDKENAASRRGLFMVDASREFVKDGNKNRLRARDIHKIVDVFNKQLELPGYARMVARQEIEANEFNLNLTRYIDSQAAEDVQDIEAHLRGGIPWRDINALQPYWDAYPGLIHTLLQPAGRDGYGVLKIPADQIKTAIFTHPEFERYTGEVLALFEAWRARHAPRLKTIGPDDRPKALIHTLAEDLLESFAGRSLIDKYDIYQHLLSYWQETMRDDCYMIVEDGWQPQPRQVKKGVWDSDLVPQPLLVARYFAAGQAEIERLEAAREEIVRQRDELEEEHSGEEGLLEEGRSEAGNITKTNVTNRLREIKGEPDFADEAEVLAAYLKLYDQERKARAAIRKAEKKLAAQVLKKYQALTPAEVKTLVVDDKWLADLCRRIEGELERVSHRLTQRIQELAERYAAPLPQLAAEVDALSDKVAGHLARMGVGNG